MKSNYTIELLKVVSRKNIEEINNLIPQLTSSVQIVLSKENIEKLINSPNTNILVAKNYLGEIIGWLTLATYPTLLRTRAAWIEDLVVNSNYRGQGIGESIMKKTLEEAKKMNVQSIFLTSRPSRVAANALYVKMGFIKKETNCYKMELT